MPRKVKKIKQKQKQKQSQKVVVNINTTKRSYTRQQPTKSNIPSNNNKVPSVIVQMLTYNQRNDPTNNPINNELLRILHQENIQNALLRNVEPQRGLIPPVPVAANNPPVAANIQPVHVAANNPPNENPLLSSAAEPNENPLLSSAAEPKENPLLSSITYNKPPIKKENKQNTKPLNFFDEMKQAVLKREAGEPIRIKKTSKPIENDSLQTNALSQEIKPESVLEKSFRLRREKIKDDEPSADEDNEWNDSGSYNENVLLPVAKEVDDEPISVDEAKPIATNTKEANRMVKEQTKINKEQAYKEYKDLGGSLPFTKDLGIKIINKNIAAINERTKLLADSNTTNDEYRKFLTKNDVIGISKLNKTELIERVTNLTL